MYLRRPGERPIVVLEPTDHPLAVDQREGITVERAHAMAVHLLADTGGAPIGP